MRVPDSAAGRKCRCPRCNALVQVRPPRPKPAAPRPRVAAPSPADTTDEISLAAAEAASEETDVLPAIEEEAAPPAQPQLDSWEQRLKASYRHSTKPPAPTWPHTLAVVGIVGLILAILLAVVLVITMR